MQGNGATPFASIPAGPESAYRGNYASLPAVTLKPPPEGNRTIPVNILWQRDGQSPSYTVHFNARSQQVVSLTQIAAVHVDNTNCGSQVSVLFTDTQFQITLAANSEGFYPVVTNSLEFWAYLATAPGANDRTTIQVLNFLPPPMTINSGTTAVAGVTSISTAAPLAGGPITSTGTISLTVPLTINYGGTGATAANTALDNLAQVSGAAAGTLTRASGGTWSLTAAGSGTISAVNPGTGIVGGGTSGAVTLSLGVPVTLANGGTGVAAANAAAVMTAWGAAPLANPGFTGSPTAPTQAPGTANTTLATTAFVNAAIVTVGGGNFVPLTGGTMTGNLWNNGGNFYLGNQTPPTGIGGGIYNLIPGAGLTMGAALGVNLTQNLYYSGANSRFENFATGGGAVLSLTGGGFTVSTAASGAAGAAAALSQTLALDASGNLAATNSVVAGRTVPVSTDAGQVITNGPFVFAGSGSTTLTANAYLSLGSWKYLTTGAATQLNAGGGTFAWYTIPSGSAGATISTFTNLMSLSAAGQLSLANTSVATGNLVYTALAPANSDCFLSLAASRNWITGTRGSAYATPGRYEIADITAGATRLAIDSTGACTNTTGTWAAISDRQLKRNIGDYHSGLAELARLQPRTFEYDERVAAPGLHRGLIADEVAAVFPELVGETALGGESGDDERVQTVDSGQLVFAIINALKELNARLAHLENDHAD